MTHQTASQAEAAQVGARIKRRREQRKLSLSGFAREVGVKPPTALGWERGEFVPRLPNLRRIATVLSCEVADLIGKRAA